MYKSQMKLLIFFTIVIPFILFASDKGDDLIKKQKPLTREKSVMVTINYGNGYIELGKTQTGNVYEGEFFYKNLRPYVQYEVVGNEGRLDVDFSGKVRTEGRDREKRSIGSLDNLYENELNLNLTPEVPIDMDLDLGVIKGKLDLSGLSIKSIDIEVGVSEASILFNESNPISMESFSLEGGVGKISIDKIANANLEEFSFEGGVGSYELDFTGEYKQDIRADIEMGMGKLKLYLPKNVGTRIEVDKSFLASFSIDEAYKKDNVYYNNSWDKTSYHLNLYVETGVGKIDVIWVDY